MTRVYFVRHAQSDHNGQEDRIRPLTEEGRRDSATVLGFLKDKKIDARSGNSRHCPKYDLAFL